MVSLRIKSSLRAVTPPPSRIVNVMVEVSVVAGHTE